MMTEMLMNFLTEIYTFIRYADFEDVVTLCFLTLFVGIAIYAGWKIYEENTYDYTTCQATEQYVDRHQNSWIQYIHNGKTSTMIIHPARDWTERLYQCPEEERWREESRNANG